MRFILLIIALPCIIAVSLVDLITDYSRDKSIEFIHEKQQRFPIKFIDFFDFIHLEASKELFGLSWINSSWRQFFTTQYPLIVKELETTSIGFADSVRIMTANIMKLFLVAHEGSDKILEFSFSSHWFYGLLEMIMHHGIRFSMRIKCPMVLSEHVISLLKRKDLHRLIIDEVEYCNEHLFKLDLMQVKELVLNSVLFKSPTIEQINEWIKRSKIELLIINEYSLGFFMPNAIDCPPQTHLSYNPFNIDDFIVANSINLSGLNLSCYQMDRISGLLYDAKAIDISHNSMDDQVSVHFVFKLKMMKKLEILSLASTNISVIALDLILSALEQSKVRLKVLDLSRNLIGDEGLVRLSSFLKKKGKHLRQLHLSGNNIHSIASLPLKKMKNLTFLNISNNPIGVVELVTTQERIPSRLVLDVSNSFS